MMNFQVSDKVVCVDGVPGRGTIEGLYRFPGGYLKQGGIYSVQNISERTDIDGDRIRVHLVGVPAIDVRDGEEVGWCPSRFRRLEDLRAEARARQQQPQPETATR